MPQRFIPFTNGEYYHIYNRGVEKRTIFSTPKNYQRFLDICAYYSYEHPPLRYSQLLNLTPVMRKQALDTHEAKSQIVAIAAFVLMPNHFHILMTQQANNGITDFMRRISDSFTKYFNKTQKRVGPLFQGRFKAVHIESDEQLIHVSRYIHLNPYKDRLVSSFDDLQKYTWSSLPLYLKKSHSHIHPDIILTHFHSLEEYIEFLRNQADYQRTLEDLKD
jgi:putative transposase